MINIFNGGWMYVMNKTQKVTVKLNNLCAVSILKCFCTERYLVN